MNTTMLLPIILIIGLMLLMTRSAKAKQRQAAQMRDQMQPGSGVRTIGGLVARVTEIRDSTVLLEIAPDTHCVFTKQAIATVLSEEEYDRLVNNDVPLTFEDSDEATADGDAADEEPKKIDLGKSEPADGTDESAVVAAESAPAEPQDAGRK